MNRILGWGNRGTRCLQLLDESYRPISARQAGFAQFSQAFGHSVGRGDEGLPELGAAPVVQGGERFAPAGIDHGQGKPALGRVVT